MAYTHPTLSGIVREISDLNTAPSGFSWRVAVLDDGNKYPNPVPVRWLKDNADKALSLKVGERATISYRLSGREHNGKYYCDVVGVDVVGGNVASKPAEPTTAEVEAAFGDDDNIPF